MHGAAAYASELFGANKIPKTKKEPCWKRRLDRKLQELNRDLDFLNILLEKRRNETFSKNVKIGWKANTMFEERDSTL